MNMPQENEYFYDMLLFILLHHFSPRTVMACERRRLIYLEFVIDTS
jgi:hypothetical protein